MQCLTQVPCRDGIDGFRHAQQPFAKHPALRWISKADLFNSGL
ncbi:hypothetical protein TH47_20760 [Thalassospira sp. MCCC 1A02803]|nr:hypothetical protein TH47_20760 [Thalassospira sp. MCCC 1A02803]